MANELCKFCVAAKNGDCETILSQIPHGQEMFSTPCGCFKNHAYLIDIMKHALKRGDLEMIKIFTSFVTYRYDHAIQYAASNCDASILKWLHNYTHCDALVDAAKNGNLESIHFFLEDMKCNVDDRTLSDMKDNALMYGHRHITSYLKDYEIEHSEKLQRRHLKKQQSEYQIIPLKKKRGRKRKITNDMPVLISAPLPPRKTKK